MGVIKNDTVRALEILDKMFEDTIEVSNTTVCPEYSWRYNGAKYAIEELIGQEINYDLRTKSHYIQGPGNEDE